MINRAASTKEAAHEATKNVVRERIDKLGEGVNERIDKLGEDLGKLRADLKNDVRGCSVRIEKQEVELEHFKQRMETELE